MFECRTKVGVVFHQCARDAVPDRSRLPRWTTTSDVDYEIEFVRSLGKLKRLANDHPQGLVREVTIEWFVVNLNLTGAGSQVNASGCRFASPGSVILNISHNNLPLISANLVMS